MELAIIQQRTGDSSAGRLGGRCRLSDVFYALNKYAVYSPTLCLGLPLRIQPASTGREAELGNSERVGFVRDAPLRVPGRN